MSRSFRRGFTLPEALASLTLLAIVLLMASGFFARRQRLERERLDREVSLRCLESEWAVLRALPAGALPPGVSGFLGPASFVEHAARRRARLTVLPDPLPGLLRVRLEIDAPRGRHIVEEGLVRPSSR